MFVLGKLSCIAKNLLCATLIPHDHVPHSQLLELTTATSYTQLFVKPSSQAPVFPCNTHCHAVTMAINTHGHVVCVNTDDSRRMTTPPHTVCIRTITQRRFTSIYTSGPCTTYLCNSSLQYTTIAQVMFVDVLDLFLFAAMGPCF